MVGNIVALMASLLMVYSGLVSQKDKIIYIQTAQVGLSVISNIVLGGFVGAIINALSCVRNILYHKDKLGAKEKIVITALAVFLSIKYNNLGFAGVLPLISSVTYLWLINTSDVVKFKFLIIFTMVLWFTYDMTIKSYSSAVFDFVTIVTNICSIFKLKKNIEVKRVAKN